MAETGIIHVAGAGFRLSLLLNAISCDVTNASLEVQSISKGVTLFSMMLKQTGQDLRSPGSVHSREAVETAKSIAEEGTRVFDEIQDMLDRVTTKAAVGATAPTIQQRFKWCFKRHRVTYLLAQLESLKLSLAVMLQILQLGKLMASTSRRDPPDEVAVKKEAINQERAEAQNAVIVRYWQMSIMDRLFDASQREDDDDRRASITSETMYDDELSPVASNSSQQVIEVPPPEYASSNALVKLPVFSLGELDHTLHQIKGSPRDMVQVSDRAIDPLLERWTQWREVREQRHKRDSGGSGRYVPSVHNLDEDDEEDIPLRYRYRERDTSPHGYYLEGITTDWRKPNSAYARQEASKRRKQYSGYQPSVSAASSDVEDSPGGSTGSKKPTSRRHIIESGSESSASEPDLANPRPRRPSSPINPVTDRKSRIPDGQPAAHGFGAAPQPPTWVASNHAGGSGSRAPSITSAQSTTSRLSSPAYHPPGHRPWANPDQSAMHHSQSSPLLPTPPYVSGAPLNHYPSHQNIGYPRYGLSLQPQSQLQPPAQLTGFGQPMNYGAPVSAQSRYVAQSSPRMGLPPRPRSQDGKPTRSPSRLAQQSTSARVYDEKRSSREKSARQNLKEGATKGLLGAGAIAGFLEALEGLSI